MEKERPKEVAKRKEVTMARATQEAVNHRGSTVSEIKHRTVETNGIHMHFAESGAGPLVLLCHGFPQSWYSWAPSVACARGSWGSMRFARYARLRADRSSRTTRSVHAAPSCWRRGRPARCFRHRDSGDRRTRLGRPRRVGTLTLFAARSLSRRDRFERVPFIPRQPVRPTSIAIAS